MGCQKKVLLSFVVCWWGVVVVRLVRFYYVGCVVCFVVGVCLLSGLREPVTHSLGGRALSCLGFVVEVSGVRACCVNIEAPTRRPRQRVGAPSEGESEGLSG